MGYFPMCVDITDRPVILVGGGEQIREKIEKLAPFSPRLIRLQRLTGEALDAEPVFVIAGDLSKAEAEQTAALCAARRIPVNVVDMPRLCTFTFPALVVRDDLTVAVSTGGKAPGAAAYIRKMIEHLLPAQTGQILSRLAQLRQEIKKNHPPRESRGIMDALTKECFDKGRPLTDEECSALLSPQGGAKDV